MAARLDVVAFIYWVQLFHRNSIHDNSKNPWLWEEWGIISLSSFDIKIPLGLRLVVSQFYPQLYVLDVH